MAKFKGPTMAQGELTIRKLDPDFKIPKGCMPLTTEHEHLIVGHSETGHHHVLHARGTEVLVAENPPEGMRILYAILKEPNSLKHLRDFDTHESIDFEEPGTYEIRAAREFDPYAELARRSAD
jgi:hypothetical protein